MPSTSKSQQRLFGIVHAYQTGKIPVGKVSTQIKKIVKSISSPITIDPYSNIDKLIHDFLSEVK